MIKVPGWLKYLEAVPAEPGSDFMCKLCFGPGDLGKFNKVPKEWHPRLSGYLGILGDLEKNLPFPHPTAEMVDSLAVKTWMSSCTTTHSGSCAPDDSSNLVGLMVIDCETLLVSPAPRNCRYVALSYVWGPPAEFAEEKYVFLLLPAQLSRTIADAISVTKQLGFRYLWVDRYCINQKDADHKMQQIRQMGLIYSSAELTIIAVAGQGPRHGLPGVSLPRRIPMPWGEVVGSVAIVFTATDPVQTIYRSTWAHRAWTFQEGYLSRRRLFFTDTTMLYVCNESMQGDVDERNYQLGDIHEHRTLSRFVPWNVPLPGVDQWPTQSNSLGSAGRQMTDFSERRLTYDTDALNAILGILDRLSKNKEDPVYHIWGVPFSRYNREFGSKYSGRISYEIAISWYHHEPCRRRKDFPSWSSIAWDGPTAYSYQDSLMTPDDVDIRVVGPNGQETLHDYVQSGRVVSDSGSPEAPRLLVLPGAISIPVKLTKSDEGAVQATLELTNGLDIPRHHVSMDDAEQDLGTAFIGVVLYRDAGSRRTHILVLSQTAKYYQRVGFILLDEESIVGVSLDRPGVCDRSTGEMVTDVAFLEKNLERPFRFQDEVKKDVVLE